MNSNEPADVVKYLKVICFLGALAWSIICWKAVSEGVLANISSDSIFGVLPDPRLEDWVRNALKILVIAGVILGGFVEGMKMLGGVWSSVSPSGGIFWAFIICMFVLSLLIMFPVVPIGASTFKSFSNTDE